MTAKQYEIVSINVGKPVEMLYKGKELTTGIYKFPVNEPVFLKTLNFNGDGQADLVHHGGKDKAVCVYPFDHYPYWEQELNRALEHAAFGENLTVKGLLEQDVCIGDIYQLGEAVVQVSQPRQPCHKLAKKYDIPDLPALVQDTGYTGFYFRVFQEGWVTKDQPLILLERHPDEVSVSFANNLMHHDKYNIEAIKRVLAVKALSDNWRKTFLNRLKGAETDVKARIEGHHD